MHKTIIAQAFLPRAIECPQYTGIRRLFTSGRTDSDTPSAFWRFEIRLRPAESSRQATELPPNRRCGRVATSHHSPTWSASLCPPQKNPAPSGSAQRELDPDRDLKERLTPSPWIRIKRGEYEAEQALCRRYDRLQQRLSVSVRDGTATSSGTRQIAIHANGNL